MEGNLYNKARLEDYLDGEGQLDNVVVKKSVVIDGIVYWSIYHNCDICGIMQKLGCVNYIKLTEYHILIKHDDLVEKYGDPFNFDDDFSVKGKSGSEIKDRLESFDFDFEGLFIGEEIGSRMCFVRSNSIDEDNIVRLTNILNLDYDEIGRLSDEDKWILCGNGWFYFKV